MGTKKAKFLEEVHQASAVRGLRKLEAEGVLVVEGDQNAGKRGPQAARIAQLTGMAKGATDLRIYIDDERLLLVELKNETGKLSKDQIEHHAKLRKLGFAVHVVQTDHPLDTCLEISKILAEAIPGLHPARTDMLMTLGAHEVLAALSGGGK